MTYGLRYVKEKMYVPADAEYIAYASIDSAVEAMRRGTADYIPKPFTPAQVLLPVRKVEEVRTLEQKVAALREDLAGAAPEVRFSSESPAMQRAMEIARQVAPTDAAVLLRGESGTGKTVLARAIHGWSRRFTKPFGVVSCPSLPGSDGWGSAARWIG